MTYVYVTGASGYLGSYLCAEMVKLGHKLICADMVSPEKTHGEFRPSDFRDPEETRKAIQGAELVVHCASIHPWKKYTDDQYLDNNVKGTWNIFQAALEHGIDRVILTSSIATSGYNPPQDLRPVPESYQQQALGDIYSITKQFQEQIARHFCAYRGMKVIALRPPNFTPKSPIQTGASLLSGCLVVEDVASAHLKALDAWDKMQNAFEPFFITPAFPYSVQELQRSSDNPKVVLDKYFPGTWDWFKERGVILRPQATAYDSSKAERLLDWKPEHTFYRWWKENCSKF